MPYVTYDLQGYEIHRRFRTTPFAGSPASLIGRGSVESFSRRSAARMRRYLRSCRANYSVFITLTYPGEFPANGQRVKRDLDVFIKALRRQIQPGTEKFSAFWFLEFQKRGAPHFHIFTNCHFDKELVSEAWFRIVGSNDQRHLLAGTRIESIRSGKWGMVVYARKYAEKQVQKQVPKEYANVGRFWGIYGDREVLAATIVFRLESGKNAIYDAFRREFDEIIRARRGEIVIKHFGVGAAVARCKSEDVILRIKALFNRYGVKSAYDESVRFEFPLIDTPVE